MNDPTHDIRQDPTRTGRRGRRGAHMHHHFHDHIQFAEHGRGGGRHRARRGAVPIAIFTLLEERPMHGYEIITELETRSDGRWRPSAGSIYPTLDKLEARGAITSSEVDGKRQFALDRPRSPDARRHPLGPGQRRAGAVEPVRHGRPRRSSPPDLRTRRPDPPDRPIRHDRAARGGDRRPRGHQAPPLRHPRHPDRKPRPTPRPSDPSTPLSTFAGVF